MLRDTEEQHHWHNHEQPLPHIMWYEGAARVLVDFFYNWVAQFILLLSYKVFVYYFSWNYCHTSVVNFIQTAGSRSSSTDSELSLHHMSA